MKAGYDVLTRAPLGNEHWHGRADVLRRGELPSPVLDDYSYEIIDAKLAPDTKAATLLQLCLYAELSKDLQGCPPKHVYVVNPGNEQTPDSSGHGSRACPLCGGTQHRTGSCWVCDNRGETTACG